MQQLIDIYSSLSQLSHSITPQNSILFIGFVIMLLPTIVTLIIFGDGDRPKSGLVKEILGEICGAISIITLIGSPIIMCCIYNPVNQGIEAPTYLKEQITKVEQSNQKRQIYTNDDNIKLTFIYKNMKYKPGIHDTGTYRIGEHYYKDEVVSVTFDKLPSDMDVPVDVFRYSVFPIQKSVKDFDTNALDDTVYGYLTGTKNQARQTTYAMLQKENIHIIETEDAKKYPEYASFQVSKIEATDGTATVTKNGKSKQVKIKNLYITLRKFISDEDRANMEADKKAEDDKNAVNKLIN